MRRGSAQHFLQTGDGFNYDYDFKEIRKYLMPISDSVISQDFQIHKLILHHFEKVRKVLLKELNYINGSLDSLAEQIVHDCSVDFSLPSPSVLNRDQLRELNFLINKITKYNRKSSQEKYNLVLSNKKLVLAMIELSNFLINNPLPLCFRIKRIVIPKDRTLYTCNLPSAIRLSTLRRASNRRYLFVQLVPPPFRSKRLNKVFFDEIIDSAVRKPETTYFNELPGEEDLFVFLRLNQSPLVIEGIFPYQGDDNPDTVKEWIDLATVIMAEFDETEDEDRASTIAILMLRFLFTVTYPLLYPLNNPGLISLNKRMERYRNRTPNDIQIQQKYIHPECNEKPVYLMFEIDSLGRSPVDWIRQAEIQLTPLDAAYCIVKAHESLSIMCVMREMAFKKKEHFDNEEFAEKMPGFDDIFELWLSFLSSAGLSDPGSLMNFVNSYSRLPGFSARILASIAYLEASLTQLEQEPE